MTRSYSCTALAAAVVVLSSAGCSTTGTGSAAGAGGGSATGTRGDVTGGASGEGAAGAGGGAVAGGPAQPVDDSYLEPRMRRMTVREFNNTVAQLLGTQRDFTSALAQDVPQEGYSRNAAQLVDPVFGRQLQAVARQLAEEAVLDPSALAECASTPGPACAEEFIADFGPRAYRRPLRSEEHVALLALYEQGAEGRPDEASQFASGVQLVLEAMLQSASFIYVHQVGELVEPGAVSALDQWEIASTLSYLLVAGPPDAPLREAAATGTLGSAEQRRAHAERLVTTAEGQAQVRNFISEWLHLGRVATIDKSDPRFADLREPMLREASDFIDEVMLRDDGTLGTLLAAGYTVVGPELEAFYGITTGLDGRASLDGTGRVGILQQGAFLTATSANNVSSPVVRGKEVLDRLACSPPLPPSFLNVVIEQPQPAPDATTRELFSAHASDPGCAVCHQRIDGVGFTFEGFGPIGDARSEQSGKPIDTSGELVTGLDVDGPLLDSADLSRKLAESGDVQRCFARQLYRYAASASDEDREDTFLRALEAEGALSNRVYDLLVSFAASDSFLLRERDAEE